MSRVGPVLQYRADRSGSRVGPVLQYRSDRSGSRSIAKGSVENRLFVRFRLLPSHPGIGPLPSILARFLARTRPAGDRMSEMGAEGVMPDLAPEPSRDRTAPFDSRTVSRADRSLAAHPSLCAVSRANPSCRRSDSTSGIGPLPGCSSQHRASRTTGQPAIERTAPFGDSVSVI